MNVYVLFNGCYSDTRVVGVYSTAELAEMASRIFRDDAHVEEYPIDEGADEMRRGCVLWFVRLDRDTGDVMECNQRDSNYGQCDTPVGEDIHKNLYTQCWGATRAEAVKIASERRRMFLAQPVQS